MASTANMMKEVIFEGKKKFLVDYVRNRGVTEFVKYALEHKLPVAIVENALEAAGLTAFRHGTQACQEAVTYYRARMSEIGFLNIPRGMGLKETVRELSPYKYKASFLVTRNLELMPELMVDKTSGLFVPLAMTTNNLLQFYHNKKDVPIFQVLCCPGLCPYQAAYIVEVQICNNGHYFSKLDYIDFYQPVQIDPKSNLKTLSNGLLSTKVQCKKIENKTVDMYNTSNLVKAIQVRVASELNPALLQGVGV